MSAYRRMMADYDYHKHTGDLPEYFDGGNGDNQGCGFSVFVGCILIALLIYSTCSYVKKKDAKQEPQQEYVTVPAYQYQTPYYPSEPSLPVVSSFTKQAEQPKVEEPKPQQVSSQAQPTKPIIISRYYEEGYENGYDDGEDDAVMNNGFGGQFDDECNYKGKKKEEYKNGYEEGYEAGYYDNKVSDK